jgi:hypothetical protein
MAFEKHPPYFRRDEMIVELTETHGKMSQDSVFFRKNKQSGPIHQAGQLHNSLDVN